MLALSIVFPSLWKLVSFLTVNPILSATNYDTPWKEVLQQSFEERLNRYQEERRMPLLSHIEIRGMQRGIKQGTVQNSRESVIEVLTVRFEVVSPEVSEAINQIEDVSVLKELLRRAIVIGSMVEFQELLSHASD